MGYSLFYAMMTFFKHFPMNLKGLVLSNIFLVLRERSVPQWLTYNGYKMVCSLGSRTKGFIVSPVKEFEDSAQLSEIHIIPTMQPWPSSSPDPAGENACSVGSTDGGQLDRKGDGGEKKRGEPYGLTGLNIAKIASCDICRVLMLNFNEMNLAIFYSICYDITVINNYQKGVNTGSFTFFFSCV